MPWDPTGAIIGPLAAIALFFGKKRKRGKWDILMIVVLLGMTAGIGLVACGSAPVNTPPPGSANTAPPVVPASTQSPVPVGPGTVSPNLPSTTPSPIETPTPTPCPTPTSTPAPIGTPTQIPPPTNPTEEQMINYISSFGITLVGNWTGGILANLWEALFTHIGYQELKSWLNGGPATIIYGGSRDCDNAPECYGGVTSNSTITFTYTGPVNPPINMLHEIGHLLDNLWNDYFTKKLEKVQFTLDGEYRAGWNSTSYTSLPREIINSQALYSSQVGGGRAWQQDGGGYVCWQQCEDWADIFANAMVGNGNINQSSDLGGQIYTFYKEMESHVLRGTP